MIFRQPNRFAIPAARVQTAIFPLIAALSRPGRWGRLIAVICLLPAVAYSQTPAAGQAKIKSAEEKALENVEKLHAEAIAESLAPIRPGVPGKSPFWNERAQRFIFAPAFDFKPVEGSKRYRFAARPEADSRERTFEAGEPWAPLTPIWKDLPVGYVTLKVEALDSEGQVLGEAGKRSFYRAAVFHGPYHERLTEYGQSGRMALESMLGRKHIQNWRRNGKPDPAYRRYCYPSKIIGAVISGMTRYATLSPRPERADEALEIARAAARHLIAVSEPAGAPLEFFPPTYVDDGGKRNPSAIARYIGQLMLTEPVAAACAYLDLYDATHDAALLEAAKRIAATYKRRQLANGTWPLKVVVSNGEPVTPNLVVPIEIVQFLDRLDGSYRITEYREVSRAAMQYILENPLKTFNWESQFEDAEPRPPYRGLSHKQETAIAIYLLDHATEDPRFTGWAEELLRYAEDQFVVWERPLPNPNDENSQETSEHWLTPAALEQFGFYVPIGSSSARVIAAYQKAYEVTGKPLYLAKACALADTLTVAQKELGDGWYPTYLWPNQDREGWINSGVLSAQVLLDLGTLLAEKSRAPSM
ncbi:MAG: hypothetical protein GX621_00815 [Pirellulaceae bacterium]|nr:hypothetical protein [Pirellulaceae bacterium]